MDVRYNFLFLWVCAPHKCGYNTCRNILSSLLRISLWAVKRWLPLMSEEEICGLGPNMKAKSLAQILDWNSVVIMTAK